MNNSMTFLIQNLKCGGCEKQIISKLEAIKGISNVQIDQEQGAVNFDFSNKDLLGIVVQSLQKMGYPLIEQHNSLLDKTKSYISCMIGRSKQ